MTETSEYRSAGWFLRITVRGDISRNDVEEYIEGRSCNQLLRSITETSEYRSAGWFLRITVGEDISRIDVEEYIGGRRVVTS
jgi:hypothetical protein